MERRAPMEFVACDHTKCLYKGLEAENFSVPGPGLSP